MKQITVNTYSAQELKDEFPKGYQRAYNQYCIDTQEMGISWGDEIIESLKGIFDASGIYLRDYSIGDDQRSFVQFNMESDVKDLQGARAQAWLEHHLLSGLRETRPFNKRIKYYSGKPYNFNKYGQIKSCPFTGVCFDEDMLESLVKDIRSGETIEDSFRNLADVASKLYKSEWESQLSEEYFLDTSFSNEWTYDERGNLI